jgi:hypothetical protein
MSRPCAVESLEQRTFLSGTIDAAAEPSVRLVTRPLVTGGTSHTFHLVVQSPAGLSTSTVGADDVSVSGPNGFRSAAQVVGVAPSTDGTRQIVTCRVAAPGGLFDRSDNGVYRVAVRDGGITDSAGAAAPGGVVGFRVVARRAAPPPPVLPIPPSASAGPLSVSITRVYAWCDHMPGFWPEPDNRQYVILSASLRNTSDQPIEVRLERAYVSFDENQLGQDTDRISVRGPDGRPNDVRTVALQPGQTLAVQFRGDGAYPEGHHGERLFVTLQFSAGDATLAVRSSAVVVRTD